jgi:hypothetical protein
VALVLSLLIHGVAMWKWMPHPLLNKTGDPLTRETQPLSLRIVPSPSVAIEPPKVAQREAPPAPLVKPMPRRVQPRPAPPPPPIIAAPTPAPPIVMPAPAPTPPQAATPAPPSPPLTQDLASYIAERRRARGESGDATVDSESQRRNDAIAANLASLSTSTFGNTPQNGGGTFQIRRMEFDDAQVTFFGWNRDIHKRTFQVLDIRRGGNPTINIAIVRQIIEIIRDHESGDFHWESKRLGRELTLSARAADNAELEAFMMKEFFTDSGQPR